MEFLLVEILMWNEMIVITTLKFSFLSYFLTTSNSKSLLIKQQWQNFIFFKYFVCVRLSHRKKDYILNNMFKCKKSSTNS